MKYGMLLSQIKIGRMELKNRFVVPPMGTNYAESNGSVSQQLVDYWIARASGGWGLLILEVTAVDPLGKAILNQPGIWADSFIPGLRHLTDEVHKYGAKMAVQLHHAGRETLSAIIGAQPVAPSLVPCPVGKEEPRELSTPEVYGLIEKFGDAARRARDSGFDAVEIHGAHGYLVAQFMSANSNKRLDEFGGTFMNRMRFPLEIVKNIKMKVGNDYPIIFRMSGDERIAGGRAIEESCAVARLMEEAGVNAIDVSTGSYQSMNWIVAPAAVSPGYIVADAERIKKSVTIPVLAVGRIHEPDFAEKVLESGKADLISMGRQSLTDPETPNKTAADGVNDIAICIGCMQGCLGYLFDPNKGKITCLVNPFCGSEGTMKIESTSTPKKVVVVGGGPGGLEAAWIMAKRGHSVTLFEKENVLGGQYRIAGVAPTKQDVLKALKYYIQMCNKYCVTFKLGTEATANLVLKEKPDTVILATGGRPFIPEMKGMKGINGPNIHLATDLLQGKMCVGKNVLVIGGGMAGAEIADFLGDYEYRITIIEMLPGIALDEQGSVRYFLLERLKDKGVNFLVNARVKEFLNDGVIYEKDGKEEKITGFNSIVLAMGAVPYNPLEAAIKDKVKEVYVIGDALKARKAIDAIREGAEIAIKV